MLHVDCKDRFPRRYPGQRGPRRSACVLLPRAGFEGALATPVTPMRLKTEADAYVGMYRCIVLDFLVDLAALQD